MAFTTIPNSLIEVGKATKKEIFDQIKANEDDLNSRLATVEGASNKIELFNTTFYNPFRQEAANGMIFGRAESDFTVNDARIAIFDISSLTFTGTLEIDLHVASSPDFTSSASVFTTKPSISMSGASSYDVSSNAVFDAGTQDISTGDYYRLDISSLPGGDNLNIFQVFIFGEAS